MGLEPYGMTEEAIRRFLERELGRGAATSSFYWESDEPEELLDLLVDALARLLAANNRALSESMKSSILRDAKMPSGVSGLH